MPVLSEVRSLPRGGSPRAFRAWPLAWPSPSGSLGWQRSPLGWRGQPGQCAAPAAVTFSRRPRTCREGDGWPWCWRARQRDTAGTAAAGHRAAVRGSRRAVGLASEGRGESCRPATASPQGEPWPPTAGHPGRSFPLDCSRPVMAAHGEGRRARRAEGAPLTPRELRHSFVSLMSEAVVPIERIARLVGHTGTTTTETVTASRSVLLPAVLSASGRDTSLATALSGTRRA